MLVTSGYTLGEFERTTSNCWSFLVLPPAPPQKKLILTPRTKELNMILNLVPWGSSAS